MKVNKKEFIKALKAASTCVYKGSQVEGYDGIHLFTETGFDTIEVISTNLEQYFSGSVDAEDASDLSVYINCKDILQVTDLPGEELIIEKVGSDLQIRGSSSVVSLRIQADMQYQFPAYSVKNLVKVDGFSEALKNVEYACDAKIGAIALRGVKFISDGNESMMVASDNLRIAVSNYFDSNFKYIVDITIPSNAVSALRTIFDDTPMTMYVSGPHIFFANATYAFCTVKVENPYPKVDAVISAAEKFEAGAVLDDGELNDAIKTVLYLAKSSSHGLVELRAKNGTLCISTLSDAGSAQAWLNPGSNIEFNFKIKVQHLVDFAKLNSGIEIRVGKGEYVLLSSENAKCIAYCDGTRKDEDWSQKKATATTTQR